MPKQIPLVQIPLKGYLKQGDTISKKTITFKEGYTGNLLTALSIKMQVYHKNTLVMDLSKDNGLTVISDKIVEIDEVNAEDNNLPAEVLLIGDFEVTESNNKRTTYFDIKYNVLKQYSK